jgi:hypothetical protein
MTVTAPLVSESVAAAVKAVAADCAAPTVVTLTGTGAAVTGRAEVLPGGPATPDTIAASTAALARLIDRHPAMLTAAVTAYAVVLPGERVAFAADRAGTTYHIQLPGVPTEPLRADRWDAMIDGVTAMIRAAAR